MPVINSNKNSSSNIYRFNGKDPFDDWTVKDGSLYGYYPRNSLINLLSKQNSVIIFEDILTIPDGVVSIENSCFKNNKRLEQVFIPSSVKHISKSAFANTVATLVVEENSYAMKYAIKYNLKYKIK